MTRIIVGGIPTKYTGEVLTIDEVCSFGRVRGSY